MKLNILDDEGFYIEDHVEGYLPEFWTSDLLGNGYYKAQYQNATLNEETGEFTNGEWVETGEAPPFDHLTPAIAKLNALMTEAGICIAPLQDAVDLDDATPEEVALLKAWKQYRVALNRLDLSTAPEIEWPIKPTDK
ncbi:tail fiber assembly protein [Yersinia enterocolitica]